MSNPKRPSRREFLAKAGSSSLLPAFNGPALVMMQGLLDGIIQKAYADSDPKAIKPRNFVYISMSPAPPRWYFDSFLNPYSKDSTITPHPFIATRFKSTQTGAAGIAEYATVPINVNGVTINAPWLWGSKIPTPTGTADMKNLLGNFLGIRGITMGSDGHAVNMVKHLRPSGSEPSLNGLVADASSAAIPSVGLNGAPMLTSAYKSAKGIGQVSANVTEDPAYSPLNAILSPFDASKDSLGSGFLKQREALAQAIGIGLSALGKFSNSGVAGSDTLFSVRNSAEDLIKKGISSVVDQYAGLFNKYHTLISQCANYASIPITQLTDKSIGIPSDRNRVRLDGVFAGNSDLRTFLTSQSRFYDLAGCFAVTEALLLNGLSSTISLTQSSPDFLNITNITDFDGKALPGQAPTSISFDEHGIGQYPSLLMSTFTYRALAACIYELATQLQKKGLWTETVVQVGAEFNRIPRTSLNGSDHGWTANSTSIFSGAIKAPLVIGDTYIDTKDGGDYGNTPTARGVSAPTLINGSLNNITPGYTTSTVAELLRVQPPLGNNSPLIRELPNGGIESTLKYEAQNKTGSGS